MPPARSARSQSRGRQTRVIAQLERELARLQESPPARHPLRARAESVLSTLANVRCAILIANDFGRYIHVNDQASRMTGYSEAELQRLSLWDLTPGVGLTTARRAWRDFLKRGRMEGRFVIRRKSGRSLRVQYVAIANVLPGLHVSALLRTRPVSRRSKTSRPRARVDP